MHTIKLSMLDSNGVITWANDHSLPNKYLHSLDDVDIVKPKILYARSQGLSLPNIFTKTLPKKL